MCKKEPHLLYFLNNFLICLIFPREIFGENSDLSKIHENLTGYILGGIKIELVRKRIKAVHRIYNYLGIACNVTKGFKRTNFFLPLLIYLLKKGIWEVKKGRVVMKIKNKVRLRIR